MVVDNSGNNTIENSTVPIKVSDVKYKKVSASNTFSLGIDMDDNLWAWGWNMYGQLGNGTKYLSNILKPTKSSDNVYTYIEAGASYSFVIDTDQYLWGIGNNTYYQMRRWN